MTNTPITLPAYFHCDLKSIFLGGQAINHKSIISLLNDAERISDFMSDYKINHALFDAESYANKKIEDAVFLTDFNKKAKGYSAEFVSQITQPLLNIVVCEMALVVLAENPTASMAQVMEALKLDVIESNCGILQVRLCVGDGFNNYIDWLHSVANNMLSRIKDSVEVNRILVEFSQLLTKMALSTALMNEEMTSLRLPNGLNVPVPKHLTEVTPFTYYNDGGGRSNSHYLLAVDNEQMNIALDSINSLEFEDDEVSQGYMAEKVADNLVLITYSIRLTLPY